MDISSVISKPGQMNGSLQPSGELGKTGIVIERNHAIDILKVIAIIGVLIIHSCSGGYSYGVGTFNWVSAVFWGSLTRASVPIFLMCSGALLLNPQKELPVRKLYFKNLLRILVALFFWAMAYKVFGLVITHTLTTQNLLQSIKEVILYLNMSLIYIICTL
ncbi:MAG TPA: acyltransferase [Clostridiaceae bacterium]|nr:acyltransferase [Clostridiaceae bacterium]